MKSYYIFASILEGMSYGFRNKELEDFVINSTGCSEAEFNREYSHAYENRNTQQTVETGY
jgi:hypothetical protein